MGLAEIQNELGQALHDFVAGLHKGPVDFYGNPTGEPAPYDIMGEIRGQWLPHWRKHAIRIKSAHVPVAVLQEMLIHGENVGPSYIQRYLEHPRVGKIDGSKVEIKIENFHIEGTSVYLNMRIDQIRQHHLLEGEVLIDLKFSEKNNFDPKKNLALRCYAMAYRKLNNTEETAVAIWNVPHGLDEGVHLATLEEQDLITTANELRKISLRIKNRKFNYPQDESVCRSCTTREMCRNPWRSEHLVRLAKRNTNHKGLLPRTRSELIAERVLEIPEGKPLPFTVEQTKLLL